jgi:ATP/maltotriose-dependent transcriptional regulator MalT/DNA-binding SARP family transcriptional activator
MNDARQGPPADGQTQTSQILQHAIVPPRLPRDLIHRLRLHRKILGQVSGKLICIVAPAGYGKTTLLADLVAMHFPGAIWVKITSAARDHIRLAELLQASLSAAVSGAIPSQLPADLKPEELGRHLGKHFNHWTREGVALVIDDVHVIRDSPNSASLMRGLVASLKSGLPVFLAGRELPRLELAQFVINDGLAVIDRRELAFRPSEIAEWWGLRRGCAIDDEVLDALTKATSGWISGLRLVEFSWRNSSDLGPARFPGDLFSDFLRTLGRALNSSEKSFLVESAILPVMTASGCDEVFGRSDSAGQLLRLESEGLVVSASGDHRRTFEYHPLIRQALLSELEKGKAGRVRQIRVRGAEYLLANGAPEAAVELFLQAGEKARAVEVIERESEACLLAGRIDTLELWARNILDYDLSSPRLFANIGSAHSAAGRFWHARKAFRLARKMVTPGTSRETLLDLELHSVYLNCYEGKYATAARSLKRIRACPPAEDSIGMGRLLRMEALHAFMARGDATQAHELMLKALRLSHTDITGFFRIAALTDLAMMCDAQGRMRESRYYNSSAKRLSKKAGDTIGYLITLNNLAADLHYEGKYSRSLSEYINALREVRLIDAPSREAIVLIGLADLLMDLKCASEALEDYRCAIEIAVTHDNPRLASMAQLRLIAYWRKTGGEIPGATSATSVDGQFGLMNADLDIEMYAGLIDADPQVAYLHFMGLLESGSPNLSFTHRILATYFASLSALRMGNEALAVTLLGEAVCRAHDASLSQALVSELRYAPSMVALLAKTSIDSAQKGEISDRLRRLERLRQSLSPGGRKEVQPAIYQLADLGSAELTDESGTRIDLYPLDVQVLALLHYRGFTTLEELGAEFWQSASPQRQRSCTYSSIRRIRNKLGRGAVRLQNGVYGLQGEDLVSSDGGEFQAATKALQGMPPGDPRRRQYLDCALALYRGDFLPDGKASWIIKTRQALSADYCDVLVMSGQEYLLAGTPEKALPALRRALKINPFRDDTNLLMLEALTRLGRKGDAYAFRQKYKERLAADLGIEAAEPRFKERRHRFGAARPVAAAELSERAGFRLAGRGDK